MVALEASHSPISSLNTGLALYPSALLPRLSRVSYHSLLCTVWSEPDNAQWSSPRGAATFFFPAQIAPMVLAKGIHCIIPRKAPQHKISTFKAEYGDGTDFVNGTLFKDDVTVAGYTVSLCTSPTFSGH